MENENKEKQSNELSDEELDNVNAGVFLQREPKKSFWTLILEFFGFGKKQTSVPSAVTTPTKNLFGGNESKTDDLFGVGDGNDKKNDMLL